MTVLPIEPVLPELRAALGESGTAVLQAPPGAGKTTRVPLALLDAPWLAGQRIVMLEPRRLATRAAARRMAASLGEAVGQTVGYRMRLDTKVGPDTRIEVVTEGLLIRQLQRDPDLSGIGLVIFDEFHERSLDADLGLALTLEARAALRPDLRLLVMSATLDGAPVARLLGDAPMITSEGRSFPVETRWAEVVDDRRIEERVARTIERALAETEGDILVFLPGSGEIRRTERLLGDARLPAGTIVAPLYGDLAQSAQDMALSPSPPGRRKIVLSTSIAETSLTIEGVRVVVDAGLMRLPKFEPRSGMTRLETTRVSQASADQRQGRAGRVAPGVCYRLWTSGEHRLLSRFTTPEIAAADLAPLALDLAQWGVADPAALAWLDPPPGPAFAQARSLLSDLGALDATGRITPHGAEMASLGAHPRLAHMMLRGKALGLGGLACDIAAMLGTRDLMRGTGDRSVDLALRLDLLGDGGRTPAEADRAALHQARDLARQFRRQIGAPAAQAGQRPSAGLLLALAYPDRVAQRRPGAAGQFLLANGKGANLATTDPLAGAEYLAIADLDGDRRNARVYLAAALDRSDLETAFADRLETVEFVTWDERAEAVAARRQTRLGALAISDERMTAPTAEAIADAVVAGIAKLGLSVLPWEPSTLNWRARVAFLRALEGEASDWPDVGDDALLAGLKTWLAPFLHGITRRSQFGRIDLSAALAELLTWEQRRRLDSLAPTHVDVPSGSRLPLDYTTGEVPVLPVRLQELFGLADTPAIAGGRVELVLHLLSPAGRPLQVTRDLAGFWADSYRGVRAEMRGRYPRHPWPENPLEAEPTARAKRRPS